MADNSNVDIVFLKPSKFEDCVVCAKYIKEDFEKAHNTLIAQEGNSMISVEPSRYIKKMSQMIKDDKSLQNEVKNIINENKKSPADIVKLTQNAEFNSTLNEYMEKFGDRTVHELKLEAFTLREEPMFLIKMIYSLAMAEDVQEHSKRNILEEQKNIYSGLKINPLKKYINNAKFEHLPVIMVGSSHGGYLAHMCAKIAPWLVDAVIDNSSYAIFLWRLFWFC